MKTTFVLLFAFITISLHAQVKTYKLAYVRMSEYDPYSYWSVGDYSKISGYVYISKDNIQIFDSATSTLVYKIKTYSEDSADITYKCSLNNKEIKIIESKNKDWSNNHTLFYNGVFHVYFNFDGKNYSNINHYLLLPK